MIVDTLGVYWASSNLKQVIADHIPSHESPYSVCDGKNETKRTEVGRHIIDHLQEELYLCKLFYHRGL
jgi:hypothetical protein